MGGQYLAQREEGVLRDDWVEPFKQCVGQVVQFVSKENLEVRLFGTTVVITWSMLIQMHPFRQCERVDDF